MKKKILFLGRFPPPVHGASKMNELYYEGKEINKNFDVERVKINYSDVLDEIGIFNVKKFFGFFISLFILFKKLAFFRPNLIYFEIAPSGIAFYRDSVYVWLCRLFNKKIIFHIHFNKIDTNTYSKIIFKMGKLIMLSEELYVSIKKITTKNKLYFLPNGLKDLIFEKDFEKIARIKESNSQLNILFLSNMIEFKGPTDVLKICQSLKRKKIDFKCLFVGDWSDQRIKEEWYSLREKLGLAKECEYLGPKYGKEKIKILEKANVLVLPSKIESFPLVAIEGFMFGSPIFSYDVGAMREIVSESVLGHVAKVGDWENLAEKLSKISPKKINYIRIRKNFRDKYLFDVVEKKLIKIFEREIFEK